MELRWSRGITRISATLYGSSKAVTPCALSVWLNYRYTLLDFLENDRNGRISGVAPRLLLESDGYYSRTWKRLDVVASSL